MANLPIEEIEKMVGSRYALTVLAGKRARDLRDGAPQLVNSNESNPILVALQEIYEGKVTPENLDLSAGIEQRQAQEHAELAIAAKALNAATLLAEAEAAAPPLPLPASYNAPDVLPIAPETPDAADAAINLALSADSDEPEAEDEDQAEPEEFTALDGNIVVTDAIDPIEE